MFHRFTRFSFLLGTVSAITAFGPAARADESGRFVRIGDRCALYGSGFVDIGNGVCGRIGELSGAHVRVDPAPRGTTSESWPTGGTANAALRTDGLGMLPGAADAQHLRVQSGSTPYDR